MAWAKSRATRRQRVRGALMDAGLLLIVIVGAPLLMWLVVLAPWL